MTDLASFLLARVAEDEQAARDVSGGTVEGERGNWRPVPTGDEWAASRGECEVEVLVGLRPGLPTPPDLKSGLWGQIAVWKDTDENYGEDPQLWLDRDILPIAKHIARHAPARVLADCQARRQIIELLAKDAASCPEDDWPESGDMWQAPVADRARHLLRLFAQPFRDHPGFDPSWAVDHAPTGG